MRKRKWTKQDLISASQKSKSIRQVLIYLKLKEAGGNYYQIKKFIKLYNINTAHFTGKVWNKGLKGIGKPRISLSKILVNNSNFQSYKLKQRLFKEKLKFPKCERCGWNEKTFDGRIPLEIHHINGNNRDNRLSNLQILCPNCHSLKPNHRGRNIKK